MTIPRQSGSQRFRRTVVVLLTGPRRKGARIAILGTAIVALVIGLKTDLEMSGGGMPVRAIILDGQQFRDPTGQERDTILGTRHPFAPPPYALETHLQYSYRCTHVFGVMIDGEIDLLLGIASLRGGDVTSIREAPGVQELAAAELRATLEQLHTRPPLGRHRPIELPKSLTLIAPGSPSPPDFPMRWGWSPSILALAAGSGGSLGPWYAIAIAFRLAAIPVIAICILWLAIRRSIAGYLDRTFARLARGQCPDCRYDLRSGGLTICPECGKDADATLAEAREIAEAINHRPPPRLDRSNEPPTG